MSNEPIPLQYASLTPRRAIDENLAVLRALKAGSYDPDIFARWHGWGAAPKIFAGSYPEEYAELLALVGEEAVDAARRTTLNAHYTDPRIAHAMWAVVPPTHHDRSAIEPGCGRGTFMSYAPGATNMVGVELDKTTADICQARFPDATVIAAGFETIEMNTGSVLVAIGNVPFGNYKLFDPVDNPGRKLPIHSHFIVKAARMLAPGGIGLLLTSRYFLDSAGSAGRDAVGDYADFIGAVRLPGDAHKAEAGCEVVTDIVVLRGRSPGDIPNHVYDWNRTYEPIRNTGVFANQWYMQHPELVLGEFEVRSGQFGPDLYVSGVTTVPNLPVALSEVVSDHFSEAPERPDVPVIPEQPKTMHTVCPGTVRSSGGIVERYTLSGWETVDDSTGELAALVEIGELARIVVANDQDGISPNEFRPKLKTAYSAYVKNWGRLNRSRATKAGKRTKPSLYGFRDDPNWLPFQCRLVTT